jgi:hypothetical protein
MPTFFAQSMFKSAPSGETVAVRNYDAYIAQKLAESETGKIVDPNVYLDAAKIFLTPELSDIQVQKKYYNAIADAKQLEESFKSLETTKSSFESALQEKLQQASRDIINSDATPDQLPNAYTYYYDNAADQLSNEIEKEKRNGKQTDTLEQLQKTYVQKANDFAELYNSMRSPQATVNPENYGLFIQTNPNTGVVVSMSLDKVDSLNKTKPGFVQTTDNFGVPIYLNTLGNVAKLGENTYTVVPVKDKDTGNNKAMAINSKTNVPWTKDLKMAFGSKQSDVLKGMDESELTRNNLSTLNSSFDELNDLPKHSAVKDTAGNFYFYNDEGKLIKTNPDFLANIFGVSKEEVMGGSYLKTKDQLKNFGQIEDINNMFNGPIKPVSVVPTAPQASQPTMGEQATTPPQETAAPVVQPVAAQPSTAVQQSRGEPRFAKTIQNIVAGGLTPIAQKLSQFSTNLFK